MLKLLWTAGALALLGYVGAPRRCAAWACRPGPVLGWSAVGLVALAGWLDPVRTTLYLGQINIVVLALVLGDVLGRPDSRWRGVGIGLAAALKLTPLLFVGYLLVLRRWRAAATATADRSGWPGRSACWRPRASRASYWWHGTFAAAGRISDVAATTNHSLNGLLARALGEGSAARAGYLRGRARCWWPATLAVAARRHRRGARAARARPCAGCASAAAAPFAWSHHWVWFVPLVRRARAAARSVGDRTAGVAAGRGAAGTVAVVTALPGPRGRARSRAPD